MIEKPKTTTRHPSGRPRKVDIDVMDKLSDLVSAGFPLRTACRVLRIGKSSIYRAYQRTPWFRDIIQDAKGDAAMARYKAIVQIVDDPSIPTSTARKLISRIKKAFR